MFLSFNGLVIVEFKKAHGIRIKIIIGLKISEISYYCVCEAEKINFLLNVYATTNTMRAPPFVRKFYPPLFVH